MRLKKYIVLFDRSGGDETPHCVLMTADEVLKIKDLENAMIIDGHVIKGFDQKNIGRKLRQYED